MNPFNSNAAASNETVLSQGAKELNSVVGMETPPTAR